MMKRGEWNRKQALSTLFNEQISHLVRAVSKTKEYSLQSYLNLQKIQIFGFNKIPLSFIFSTKV